MAGIPIKPLTDIAKTQGPKAMKFIKENKEIIVSVGGMAGTAGKKINDLRKSKNENKQNPGKYHYRKERYINYKTVVLKNLDNKKRSELFQYKLEIEKFIKQIEKENNDEIAMKKPLHTKRMGNWKDMLKQVEDKMAIKDYQEYLMIYNNPNYESEYFEGYDNQIRKFKKVISSGDNNDICNCIHQVTGEDVNKIKKDIFL